MRLRLPDVKQPDAVSVAAVPEAPGMFRVAYSDGSCSEAMRADQLTGIARLLLAQSQPPCRKRKRKPSHWLSDLREIARRKRAQRAEQQRARRAKKRKSLETARSHHGEKHNSTLGNIFDEDETSVSKVGDLLADSRADTSDGNDSGANTQVVPE